MKRLVIQNSWESYYYYEKGKEDYNDNIDTSQIKEVIIDGHSYKPVFESKRVSYSDWGHTCETYQEHLYIRVNGFKVDLSEQMFEDEDLVVYFTYK